MTKMTSGTSDTIAASVTSDRRHKNSNNTLSCLATKTEVYLTGTHGGGVWRVAGLWQGQTAASEQNIWLKSKTISLSNSLCSDTARHVWRKSVTGSEGIDTVSLGRVVKSVNSASDLFTVGYNTRLSEIISVSFCFVLISFCWEVGVTFVTDLYRVCV